MKLTTENGLPKKLKNNQNITYPLTYVLKVIVTLDESVNIRQQQIEDLLFQLGITFSFVEVKNSSKSTYASFSIGIVLLNTKQMNDLYTELGKLPGIKLAI